MKRNISGLLYFYIHFIVEIICFYALSSLYGDSIIFWVIPFIYDALAFVPQSLLGALSDKYKKIPIGLIGTFLLFSGLLCFGLNLVSIYISIVTITLGNACVHVAGAEVTLRSSEGKISPSAIFVAGGSFGVLAGKLLSGVAPFWFILILALSMVPFIILAESYRKESKPDACKNFNYINEKIPKALITIFAVLVVAVRGYMGYGIPTAWNKTTVQMILLYVSMGIGKGLGGILCDKIGVRKTAIISVVGALPFLIFGDNIMIVSLIGIMLFSMTMSVTLALLVSALKKSPGLAFGLTTIGLFLGTAPIFFFTPANFSTNCFIVVSASLVCLLLLMIITRKEKVHV